MKKKLSVLLIGVLIVLLGACGGAFGIGKGKNGGGKKAADSASAPVSGIGKTNPVFQGKKIGISFPDETDLKRKRASTFLSEQLKNDGCETVVSYAKKSSTQQIADIRHMLSEKTDLLVISPVDTKALSDTLSAAKQAGVPVINTDNLIEKTDAVSCFISYDNYSIGKTIGEYVLNDYNLKKAGSREYNVEFSAENPEASSSHATYNGAWDVLNPYIDQGKIKIQSGQNSYGLASEMSKTADDITGRMQNIVDAYYPKGTVLNAIVCLDDLNAVACQKAVESDYWDLKDYPLITGQHADDAALKNVMDGKQGMTLFLSPTDEAEVVISAAGELLSGKKPGKDLAEKESWIFDCTYNEKDYNTGSGAVPAYLIIPELITKDNMKSKLIDTGYYTMKDNYPVEKE